MTARLAAALLVAAPAFAGSWQPLNHPYPLPEVIDPGGNDLGPGGATAPILLTDGRVIVLNAGAAADGRIFALSPDENGSYVNGTWSELATMPYIEWAAAQAVLPDGRVIIEGGEYTGYTFDFTLTNQGAIYDPVTNTWQSVPPPAFFDDLVPRRRTFAPHPIGDAASVVLADGTFMVEDKMSRQAALLDLATLTWTETGTATKADMNDEEGLTLLPDGRVLTVDCYTDVLFGVADHPYPDDPTVSEIYDPRTGSWSYGGSTINSLTDHATAEIGPALLRPDGTVFAVGSQGFTSIFDTRTSTWSAGPRLPLNPDGLQLTAVDAAGALLPNGNVLFSASGGFFDADGFFNGPPPLSFVEFDGTGYTLEPVPPNASYEVSASVVLLVLPTGQVLSADGSGDVEIYTPSDQHHRHEWEPSVTSAPRVVHPGGSYSLSGVRLNGMSQASAFGDEVQNATNYPLVRITNHRTGHVFYSRTHDHSSMAVASPDVVSTTFDVPPWQELGQSRLEVVANGIASRPVEVDVR